MAQDIAELGFKVDSKGFVRASDHMDRMERSSERLSRKMADMGRIVGLAAVAAGAAMGALAVKAVKMAVAAEEVAAKFQVVFRGSVEETNKALIELGKTVPLTVSEMRGLAAGVQDMIVPLGIARDEAAKLSVSAVQLAADIGSFNNVEPDQVLRDIQSALAGSSEPLRKYGVDVREAALQSVALSEGIMEVGETMTQAQRAQALFIKITRDSSDAMGDAARTADSAANRMKFFGRDVRQAQEDLGKALIPTLSLLLERLQAVGDDGVTPLQEIMRSVTETVLLMTRTILRAVEGFNMMATGIANVGDRIRDEISSPGWMSFIEGATRLAGGPMAGGAADAAGVLADNPEALAAAREAAQERITKRTEELNAALAGTRAAIDAIDKEIAGLEKPIDRTIGEMAGGLEDAAGVVKGQLIPALREMDEIISRDLQDSFDFITGEGLFREQAQALQDEITALQGGEEAWREYNKQQFIAAEVGKIQGKVSDEQREKIASLAGSLFEARDGFAGLVDQSVTLGDTLQAVGGSFEDVIRSIQQGTERGTNEYKKLEVAVQAVNILQAIGAILNQSQGDPYTAIPRMAAMASIVSSLVGAVFSISGMSGGGSDPTAARQASIGTGTVLGDSEAQSESIMNALDITADATSELVGINRGMLRALTNLVDAIAGASNLLARGFGDTNFGALPSAEDFKAFGFDKILGKALDPLGILGGSVKIADTGITIAQGSLEELINGALIQGFQDLSIKKNIFSSSKIRRGTVELEDAVQSQFGKVFEALVETVSQAALILGITQDQIQARLDAFVVYAQDISFEDLNAEEQQEALTAFFSSVFDRLANDVVPFIGDFQQVGEGMGETLVRVATSIQVFDEALNQIEFGFRDFNESLWGSYDDFIYRTTTWKVALVDAAGGIEAFINQFTTFVDLFATDQMKFDTLSRNLNEAFEQIGLQVPESRDAIWSLMQAQDAETEAGRERIAMLLELAPALDEFYDLIEQRTKTLTDFIGLGPPAALTNLRESFEEAMMAAKSLGASQREYALILRSFERQLQRMGAELQISVIQQSQALFGSAADAANDEFESGFEGVRQVANSLFSEWQRALTNIKGYADGLLLDENLTTLNPAQRLAEAQRQYEDILRAAQGGDVEAAGNLPDAAQAFLEAARFMFASSGPYQQIFNDVQTALRGIEMPDGIPEWTEETAGNTGLTARASQAIERAQNETVNQLQQLLQAMDLAETLGSLGYVLERSPLELANELGVPLDQLATLLGIDITDASAETVNAILSMADLLGADVYALADTLGFDIQTVADSFNIALDQINFERAFMTQEDWLGGIFDQIGITNNILTTAFGIDAPPIAGYDPNNPNPIGPVPQPSGTSGSSSTSDEQLAEIRAILGDMRDSDERYYDTISAETKELVRATIDSSDALKRIA